MKIFRKSLCLLLVAAVLCAMLVTTSYAADVIATPTKSTLSFNNTIVNLEGYTISGNNYFKLRDLAVVIKDNGKNFSVNWEKATNIVSLKLGESYSLVGGELTLSGNTVSVKAAPTTSRVYMDGKQIFLTAYLINNANYIKLRDLAAALDIGVIFDETINMVSVDTSKEYYVTSLMDVLDGAYYNTTKKIVTFQNNDSGKFTIEKKSAKHFVITADSISGDSSYAIFKTIIGLYVSSPDDVINTLQGLKYSGRDELLLDGKNLVCMYDMLIQTVDISW